MDLRALHLPRFLVFPLIALFLLGTVAPFPAASTASRAGSFQPLAHPIRTPRGVARIPRIPNQPPTDAECRASIGVPCYSPQEIQTAYNETPLLNSGKNGAGQTILIVDSYGSPTIQQDLATFDTDFGLPAPPSFKVISPLGRPAWDPNDATMAGWAEETSLDVEWAHSMAPGASIILLTSPTAETEGPNGIPQMASVEQYALDNHLGQVISQSWAATENTFFNAPNGDTAIADLENVYKQAAAQGVTVLGSTGDYGSANASNVAGTTFYSFPTVNFPASSPLVTAVGGTTLYADTNGNYQSEIVWNNNYLQANPIATGGGVSVIWPEPTWQQGLPAGTQSYLKGHRGLPDISSNADPYTPVLVYLSFPNNQGISAGYYLFGGTSEASPVWAGFVAVADQIAGRPLGYLNPTLYAIGTSAARAKSFHDITQGNNANMGVPGYGATVGWDASTGWGSPDTAVLLPELGASEASSR